MLYLNINDNWFWVLGIWVLLYELYTFVRAVQTSRYIHENNNYHKNVKAVNYNHYNYKLYIVIPVHESPLTVAKAIKNFAKLKSNSVIVWFILDTETENRIKKSSMEFLLDRKDVKIDRDSKSTKVSKLRYAYAMIKEIEREPEKIFLGVYDADATPGANELNFIQDKLSMYGNNITAFQEIPVYLKSANKSPIFIRAFYRFHLRRAFGIEGISFLGNAKREIIYLMGSGMYIKLKDLISVGGFPMYSDDIELGYKFYVRGKKEIIIPKIAKVDYVSNFTDMWNQYLRIFYGIFSSLFSIFKMLKKEKSLNLFQKLWKAIFAVISNFLSQLELVSLVFFLLFDHNLFFKCFILVALVVLSYLYELMYQDLSKSDSIKERIEFSVLSILYYPMLFIFRMAVMCLYIFFKNRVIKLFRRSTQKNEK